MVKTYLLLHLALLLLIVNKSYAQSLRVATYNIRYDNPEDSLNSWKYRLPVVKDLVRFHDFDILSIQEGLQHQVMQLEKQLEVFEFYGVGRDDGKTQGEYSGIFYKKNKFKRTEGGTFWLSETPDRPSKGWDAALPRICTWIKLLDKNGNPFFVFNTHFDHKGVQARKESIKLIMKKIQEIAGKSPVILTGDFNFSQKDENFTLALTSKYLKDGYSAAEVRYAPNGTFNGFDITSKSEDRIDHIFVSPHFTVKKYAILTDSYLGRFPSDHFPVVVDLEYK